MESLQVLIGLIQDLEPEKVLHSWQRTMKIKVIGPSLTALDGGLVGLDVITTTGITGTTVAV